MPVTGSIQSDVPVKPVCPNDPTGSSSPRLDEYDGIDVPAETAHVAIRRTGRRRRHLRDRQRRQDARAAIDATVEQHAAEDGEIGGRAEETGVAGDAAHPPGRRIVDDAAKHRHSWSLARPSERRAVLGRRNARTQAPGGKKHRVLHPERREDPIVRKAIERLPAHAADDVAEQKVIDVAVDESFTRRSGGHLFDGNVDRRVGAAPGIAEIDVGTEPGHMRHQMANRDVRLCRNARNPG